MTPRYKLNRIDLKILAELQRNGRMALLHISDVSGFTLRIHAVRWAA